jgi:sigma-B regulation protein RsbU (phosphoserine phosphatase)
MFMAVTRTLFRTFNRSTDSLGELVTNVNSRLLQRDSKRMMFVTLFVGLYDVKTGKVRYVNAGHPPPRLIGPKGLRPIGEDTGALVGVVEGQTWTDGVDTIAPGEALVLYTDGITEAGMGVRDLYGEKRMDDLLCTCAGRTASEVTQALAADVARYEGEQPADDVTLLVLRRIQ